MDNMGNLAAPIELSLPQLCLAVSAKEVVTGVSSRGRGLSERGDTAKKDNGEPAADGAKGGGGEAGSTGKLFRKRQPLFFFVVDCRPKNQVCVEIGGRWHERVSANDDVMTFTGRRWGGSRGPGVGWVLP